MMIIIKPKKDTMSNAKPTNLKPNFKKNGPNEQNNNINPIIMAIIPAVAFIIFPPFFLFKIQIISLVKTMNRNHI